VSIQFLLFFNDEHFKKDNSNKATGLLPTVMLAVLMALVPIVLRLVGKWSGTPSTSQLELKVQSSYFAFQCVQGFLVTTFSSSAASVGAAIAKNPSSAPSLLSSNLPLSANFFISYIVLQGLSLSSGTILQIAGLVVSKILGRLFDKTPRAMYKRWITLSAIGWGTLYPAFTILLVITLSYSIINPLILVFAAIGFALVYVAFRYNFLYATTSSVDTRGVSYAYALQHIMVGLYLSEVVMVGLFAVSKAIGPIILEVIFLVFTILYHMKMNSALKPLQVYLPRDLIVEEELLSQHESTLNGENNGVKSANELEAGELKPDTLTSNGSIDRKADGSIAKKPNFFSKWLRPDKYCDYKTVRRLIPQHPPEIIYTEEELRDAYYNPAVRSETPLLWIPKDKLGISDQEVRHTSKVIPISNEGSTLTEENKVEWNREEQPPVYSKTVTW
jgi:hypothetical protein